MASICRICMETTPDLLPIASHQKDDVVQILKLGIMFEECLGVEVTDILDFLKICMECKIQLSYFYDFKQQALKTHRLLLKLTKDSRECCEGELNQSVSGNGGYDTDNVYADQTVCPSEFVAHESFELAIKTEILEENEQQDENLIENDEATAEYLDDENENDWFASVFDNDENSEAEEHIESERASVVNDELELSVGEKFQNVYAESENFETINDDGEDESCDVQYEIEEAEFLDDTTEKSKTTQTIIKDTKSRLKYNCEICGKHFRNIESFQGHWNVHLGLPAFRCKICEKEFKFKVNHDYHMKNHYNSRNFKCTICEKMCISNWDLKIHMRTHTDLRPFTCKICGKGFRVRSHMTDHLETHNQENNIKCSICSQMYKTKASLKMHVATVHTKSHQFVCAICGKVFYRSHHLKVHQKVHQRNSKNDRNNLQKSRIVTEAFMS